MVNFSWEQRIAQFALTCSKATLVLSIAYAIWKLVEVKELAQTYIQAVLN